MFAEVPMLSPAMAALLTLTDFSPEVRPVLGERKRRACTRPLSHWRPKCGRNDPCPCGSGKKYKKCHRGPA